MKWDYFCSYRDEQWQVVHVGTSGGNAPETRQDDPQATAEENVRQEETGDPAQQSAAEEPAGQWAVRPLQPTQRSVQVILNSTQEWRGCIP